MNMTEVVVGEPRFAESYEAVELFGTTFTNVSFEGVCDFVDARVLQRAPAYVVTPNVDHLCRLTRDTAFRDAYGGASLVLADGAPILWFSRLLGRPLREKLSGSDLVPRLSAYAAAKGYRVFFFGAGPGVAEEAAARLTARYPGLPVVGAVSPPMGFYDDPVEAQAMAESVRRAEADICFVALGAPHQELWMSRYHQAAGVPVMIGIGAGLDFVAGRVRRAPRWVQRAGLEWLWRLCREPRRLWRRYLIDDSYFLVLLWREFQKARPRRAEGA